MGVWRRDGNGIGVYNSNGEEDCGMDGDRRNEINIKSVDRVVADVVFSDWVEPIALRIRVDKKTRGQWG